MVPAEMCGWWGGRGYRESEDRRTDKKEGPWTLQQNCRNAPTKPVDAKPKEPLGRKNS